MKCSGKADTTWAILRSITFSPLHFMLYRGKSNSFAGPGGDSCWKEYGIGGEEWVYQTFLAQNHFQNYTPTSPIDRSVSHLPHGRTTQFDLKLWALEQRARSYSTVCAQTTGALEQRQLCIADDCSLYSMEIFSLSFVHLMFRVM